MYHSNVAQRSLIHQICRGRRGHCPWSKIVHVEQFCFTWKLLMVMWNKNFTSQANLHHMTKLFSCGVILVCGSTTNCSLYHTLLHVTNLQCMLSWRDLHCFGAKSILSRFTYFCVEQKWTQKSCPWSKTDKYDVCAHCSVGMYHSDVAKCSVLSGM